MHPHNCWAIYQTRKKYKEIIKEYFTRPTWLKVSWRFNLRAAAWWRWSSDTLKIEMHTPRLGHIGIVKKERQPNRYPFLLCWLVIFVVFFRSLRARCGIPPRRSGNFSQLQKDNLICLLFVLSALSLTLCAHIVSIY